MKYGQIVKGTFIERPNRFIAYVNIDGKQETVHVKNTGRCRELLIPGAAVYLEKNDSPERKTAYDLVAVEKIAVQDTQMSDSEKQQVDKELQSPNSEKQQADMKLELTDRKARLINMDSQAPNKVVEEWLWKKELFSDLVFVRPETKFGNSRFDFYVEYGTEKKKQKAFIEVKGVTLERDGIVLFPDAPSDRAVKHVEELIQAKEAGYGAYIIFVIQMTGVNYFTPNRETHSAFAKALERAEASGVQLLAYDCDVMLDGQPWTAGKTEAEEENVKKEPDGSNVVRLEMEKVWQTLTLNIRSSVPILLSLEKIKNTFRKELLFLISKPILKWYDSSRRILPWREEPTPYHVWVSEIMLQQTRVEAVKPYYRRFMEALPDIESLADAEEEHLLKLWEGLGYYSRVRNLQNAARQIMNEYDGRMPDVYEELLKLKGIGSYTAGAIASIAFGRRVPAVDGNVLRVISRICMDDGLITDAKVKQRMELLLRETMSEERPGDFNQAVMELGAMVCIPNGAPHCQVCPLAHLCLAHQNHCEEMFPQKAEKKARTIEEKTVLIVQDADKAAIRKRPGKGLLAGLYEFPSMEGHKTAEEVVDYLVQNGMKPLRIQQLSDSKHVFTHKEWHMKGYQVRVDELEPYEPGDKIKDWLFVEPAQTKEKYPIPSAFAAYVPYLNIKLGKEAFVQERGKKR